MKKILIVDDENEVREIIYALLELHIDSSEVELFEASSFETAAELIEKNHFHLIITDLCLSGATGFDLMNFVRQTAQNKMTRTGIEIAAIASKKYGGTTKLLAITGLAELIDYSDSFTMFSKIIEKPFPDNFPDLVMDLLKN